MRRIVALLGLTLGVTGTAQAYVECPLTLASIYAGDNGSIWATSLENTTFMIGPDNPNLKNALTLMTAALMGGNKVSVRFSSAAECSGIKYDFAGVWLLKK